MKTYKFLSLCGVALLFGCSAATSPKLWQEQVSALVAEGQLTRAEAFMDSVKTADAAASLWQIDSLKENIRRLRLEFKVSQEEGLAQLYKRIPGVDSARIKAWEEAKLLETRMIDGEKRFFNRAVNNLILLAPDLQKLRDSLGYGDDTEHQFNVEHTGEIVKATKKMGELTNPIQMSINYTLTVKPNAVPAGDTIRCWLPIAQEIDRQQQLQIIRAQPAQYAVAPNGSDHRSVYMEQVAVQDSATVFNLKFTYTAYASYFSPQEMAAKIKPYDTNSELYKTYTAQRKPHLLYLGRIADKAKEVVGSETDPIKKTALIYDWIDANFPWASAIEYGVIPNIPEYVLDINHGDCGQVSLLLIAMLRSQGIPAKWESGWMLHPGSVNLHDWAAAYYEGVGWVPMDMSFGNNPTEDPAVKNFFKSGIDSYRLVVNNDYGRDFIPAKKHLRSEPVDFQRGEVEWKGGNLYFPQWSYNMQVTYKK